MYNSQHGIIKLYKNVSLCPCPKGQYEKSFFKLGYIRNQVKRGCEVPEKCGSPFLHSLVRVVLVCFLSAVNCGSAQDSATSHQEHHPQQHVAAVPGLGRGGVGGTADGTGAWPTAEEAEADGQRSVARKRGSGVCIAGKLIRHIGTVVDHLVHLIQHVRRKGVGKRRTDCRREAGIARLIRAVHRHLAVVVYLQCHSTGDFRCQRGIAAVCRKMCFPII